MPVELFFHRSFTMKRRNLHIIFAAVVFGTIVWLSVSMRDQYQVNILVPLTLESIPEGYAVRTPVPQNLQVRLRGDGWRLATLLLGPDLRLLMPYSALVPGKHIVLVNEVADRLALRPGIDVVDITPDTLAIELDHFTRTRVPVAVDCSLSFGDMYGEVGPMIVVPDSVLLSGAESVLKSIDSWKTEHQSFSNLHAPLDADIPLTLSTPYLLSVSPSAVRIHVNVEQFAEKEFTGLPVGILAVPKDREVMLVPPRIDVVVRAGMRQLSSLSESDFHVIATYTTILADTTGTVEPQITAPAGVQILSLRPDRLTYIIRKPL